MPIYQDLRIDKIELTSHRRSSASNKLNLMEYMQQFELVEDLYSNTLRATLVLNEVHNVASSPIDRSHAPGPIIGGERVTIQFEEKKNNTQIKDLEMMVYNISTRSLVTGHKQVTVLDLVSVEFVENSKLKISKSYVDKKYSEVVSAILKDTLKVKQDLNVETTDKPKNFMIPYWNPYQAINWMAARSISPTYKGASYLFFETLNDLNKVQRPTLHFVTLEKLYEAKPVRILETTVANVTDPSKSPEEYAKFSANRINKYDYHKTFNVLENLMSGMYSNTLIHHDILNKNFEVSSFDYLEEYPKLKHLGDGRLVSKLTQDYTKAAEQNMMVYVKNNSMYKKTSQDESAKTWATVRKSQLQQLNNVKILVQAPGDCSLSVGNIIDLKISPPIYSPDIPQTQEESLDKYYRGNFLITGVKHTLDKESQNRLTYSMTLELAKDTLHVNPLSESELPGRK